MSMKVKKIQFEWKGHYPSKYCVFCPACSQIHYIDMSTSEAEGNKYPPMFNGNMEAPSFDKTIETVVNWPQDRSEVCVALIQNGFWKYLPWSTHEFAGETVPMVDIPENYRV